MTIRAQLIKETEKARLIRYQGNEFWVPRSVCKSFTRFAPQPGKAQEVEITLESWFARTKGLE